MQIHVIFTVPSEKKKSTKTQTHTILLLASRNILAVTNTFPIKPCYISTDMRSGFHGYGKGSLLIADNNLMCVYSKQVGVSNDMYKALVLL